MNSQVLVLKKRVIVGKNRDVFLPDDEEPIKLPNKNLDEATLKRIVDRGCGVVMSVQDFEQTVKKGEK